MVDLAALTRIPKSLLGAAAHGTVLAARTLEALARGIDDGSLGHAVDGFTRLPEALDKLDGLPEALVTVRTLPAALNGLSSAIAELRVELHDVPLRLDALLEDTVPVMRQLSDVLPALGDTTRLLADLQPAVDASRAALAVLGQGDLPAKLESSVKQLPGLVDQGRALAEWVALELSPQRHALPEMLTQLQTEVLPMLKTLSGTGADVVALRETAERLVGVLDAVGSQLGTLPGAALIRRRAARDPHHLTNG